MPDGLSPCSFRQVDNHGRILCNLIKGGDREVSVNLCRVCPVQAINCQHLRASLEKKISTPLTVRFATGRVEVWDDEPPGIEFKQAACAAKTMPIHSPRDCAGCPIRMPNVIPANAIQTAYRTRQAPAATNAVAALTSAESRKAPARTETGTDNRKNRARATQPTTRQTTPPIQAAPPVQVPLSNAASDLIARAQATAQRKADERIAAAVRQTAEARDSYPQPAEGKSKIIQLQEWVAAQVNRKQAHQPLPVSADEDGVSEIVYAPLGGQVAQAYQETPDYERCVGWTD